MRLSVLSWIFSVLALVGLFAWISASVTTPAAKTTGEPLVGGEFTLTNAAGETVTDKSLRGRYLLVYFGYTHCPDICPTGLLLIENTLKRLGKKGNGIIPVFITLDPERDSPKVVGDYVKHFGQRFLGLSGTPEQIKQVTDEYKVYYSRVDAKDSASGYLVDHSSFMYLMGPDGKYLAHFPHNIGEQALAEGILKRMQ